MELKSQARIGQLVKIEDKGAAGNEVERTLAVTEVEMPPQDGLGSLQL